MSLRLIDFIRTAARHAAAPRDDQAARLIDFPYSGLSRVDARAFTIQPNATLSHASNLAVQRFSRSLETIVSAYREEPRSAQAFVRTVALAFALEEQLTEKERATLAAVEREAALLDAKGTWDAIALERALRRYARTLASSREAYSPLPLPKHAPETPQPVPRRKMHFSASSLGMFAECERRWFYRYVCAAVEDKGSAAALYGTAFHWALEQFHMEFPRADAAPHDELARKLESWVNGAFERFRPSFDTNVAFELQLRRARRTAPRYLDWFIRRSREHPFSVIGTEAHAALELEGYDFIGYIDRLDREDGTGNVTVVDYKTGSIAASAAEHRAKITSLIDFQLPFYYWVRTAAGDRVTRLSLVPLKDASLEVQPIELEVIPMSAPQSAKDMPVGTIGIDELEKARSKMIALARTLTEDPISAFKTANDPDACVWCAYTNACRERPARPAQRFAR